MKGLDSRLQTPGSRKNLGRGRPDLGPGAFFNSKIRLGSVHLTNVRLVSDLRLTSLGEVTVLVGENGAGKTTVLECVSFFLQQLVEALRAGLSPTGQARGLEVPPIPRQFLKAGAPALLVAMWISRSGPRDELGA